MITGIDKEIICDDGTVLTLFTHVWRIVKEPDKTYHIRIPVYKDKENNKYHRGLPSFLIPHKHYTAQTIQSVIDDEDDIRSSLISDCLRRIWISWYESHKDHFDKKLIQYRSAVEEYLLDLGMKLPDHNNSMPDKLRTLFPGHIDVEDVPDNYYHYDDGWLAVISQIITNSFSLVPI